jgi:hypothetical protein
MMWIDIGVTVLLTIRLALFRPALPELVDPNNNISVPEEKDEQQECLFVVMEKRTNTFLESPHQGTVGLLQLHIHVMPDSKDVGDFVTPSQYNLSQRCASKRCANILEACGQ